MAATNGIPMFGKEKKQTNFQLVRTVLDELDAEVRNAHGSKHIDLVNEAMDTLQGQYARLEDPKNPRIDYSTAVARLAYILKYVAAHGDYVKQVLNLLHDELGAGLSAKENLAVSCLGGGPGSELVGLLKYLLNQDECKTKHLTVHLLDVE